MDIITIVIIALLIVIAGLGILLYKIVNRRNQTTIVMAEIVRDLAKQNADKASTGTKTKQELRTDTSD